MLTRRVTISTPVITLVAAVALVIAILWAGAAGKRQWDAVDRARADLAVLAAKVAALETAPGPPTIDCVLVHDHPNPNRR